MMGRFNKVKCVLFDMDGLLLDTENLYTEVNMWFCFTWWIIYDNDCDNCNDDSDDIIENMTVIMAQMIKIFSSGNPKSSVRVWPYIWLGFQGNPDWMIMMMMMTVMIMMTMMMTTMMTIKTNAGKTNGKADGRGGEDGRWALQASYGAHRLDWQIKALSTFWSRSSIL